MSLLLLFLLESTSLNESPGISSAPSHFVHAERQTIRYLTKERSTERFLLDTLLAFSDYFTISCLVPALLLPWLPGINISEGAGNTQTLPCSTGQAQEHPTYSLLLFTVASTGTHLGRPQGTRSKKLGTCVTEI